MTSYRIDIQLPNVALVPCVFIPSVVPGQTLTVNENGAAIVVDPDGSERATPVPAGDPNWDSPYTRGVIYGDLLVYRSATATFPGVPRAYRMVTS